MKIKKSKIKILTTLFIMITFVFVMFLFSGCNSKNESEKIVIWAFDYYIDAAKEAVKLYNQKHPHIKFEIIELAQDDLVQKFNIALASKNKENMPDIIVEEYYNIKGYLEFFEEFFTDLTPYIDPTLYVDFTIKNVTYNDKIWGIPYDTGVGAWFYRSDIFKEAGFSEADLQFITWDRFIEIGKVVKEKTGKYIIPLVPEGNIEGRVMLQSTGSWYYDYDGNINIKNNKAIVDMTKTIKMLMSSGVIHEVSSWDDLIASFYNDISAGIIGGNWWSAIISDNELQFGLWKVAPPPRMIGDEKYTNYSNTAGCAWYVLNKNNKHMAIDFLMETIAISEPLLDNLIQKTTVVPALKSAKNLKSAKKGDPYFGNQNLVEIMADWSMHVPYVNYGCHSYEIAYYHGSLFHDYLKGKTNLDDVIKELHQKAIIIEKQ